MIENTIWNAIGNDRLLQPFIKHDIKCSTIIVDCLWTKNSCCIVKHSTVIAIHHAWDPDVTCESVKACKHRHWYTFQTFLPIVNELDCKDCTLLENPTKTSRFWFLLPCFSVHRHFSISRRRGGFPKPVIYPPTYRNWIFDSIYLSNLFKPSSCEGGLLGHSEVSVGSEI